MTKSSEAGKQEVQGEGWLGLREWRGPKKTLHHTGDFQNSALSTLLSIPLSKDAIGCLRPVGSSAPVKDSGFSSVVSLAHGSMHRTKGPKMPTTEPQTAGMGTISPRRVSRNIGGGMALVTLPTGSGFSQIIGLAFGTWVPVCWVSVLHMCLSAYHVHTSAHR
jgi:hypothetical protein